MGQIWDAQCVDGTGWDYLVKIVTLVSSYFKDEKTERDRNYTKKKL